MRVAADIIARFKSEPAVGKTDLANAFEIGAVKSTGNDGHPVGLLAPLGAGHVVFICEEVCSRRCRFDNVVERRERSGQRLFNGWTTLRQGLPRWRVKPQKVQTFRPIVFLHASLHSRFDC